MKKGQGTEMIKRAFRSIAERPWLRISLAHYCLLPALRQWVHRFCQIIRCARPSAPPRRLPRVALTLIALTIGLTDGCDTTDPGGQRELGKVASLPQAVVQLEATGKGQPMVFARTGDSIWRSEDAGATWAKAKALPSNPMSMAVAKDSSRNKFRFAGSACTVVWPPERGRMV